MEISIWLVRQILHELVESKILSEIRKRKEDKEVLYQPTRDVETLTIKQAIDALENRGNSNIPVVDSKDLRKLTDTLAAFHEIVEHTPKNVTLKRI